jgi:hypothetical protein
VTIATQRTMLAEYLIYDDGTENRYELVDGELISVLDIVEYWIVDPIET